MKKIILLVLITIMTTSAQDNAGLSFLKIGFGARNMAMGDLGVASANDVTALYYNPALINEYTAPQITVTHNQWIQDVSGEMLGVSFSMLGLPFAFGLNTTSVSDIEVRSRPGTVESTFNANFFFGSLSTGFKVYEKLSAGVTIKYLYENLFSDDANGLGFDFGLHYTDVVEGLDLGASLRNVGSMNKLREQETELPTDFRVGAAYNFEVKSIKSDVVVTGGYQKYNSSDDNHIHVGGEVLYDNLFALRGGYITGYDSRGLTAGLGILWNSMNFDYAFTPFDYGLGDSHTISLMYSF